jgi:hypothetical protein
MKLADILKDSSYKLSQFSIAEIEQLEQSITLKPSKSGEVAYINCLVYLSIYLNSIIGKLFVEKHFKGSSGQIELYPSEIAQFQIWNAPESVQQKIRSKVEASHQKREQSKQLLEIAKTGVEQAIETNEATATAWINQQLTMLGITLSKSN